MRAFRSALMLALASAALTLFASARQWVHLTYQEPGLPTINLDLSGRDLDPLPAGLAILIVAAVSALSISRGLAHRFIAVVIALAGVTVVMASWRAGAHPEQLATISDHIEASLGRTASGQTTQTATLWWTVSLFCGVLVTVSGGVLVTAGPNRPRGSSTYERPSADASKISPWQALDQGVDPTSTPDR